MFCKIRVKNQQVPCKIYFKYKTDGEINVYASLKSREPDYYSNDFAKHGRPTCLVITNAEETNYFKDPFIYLNLEAHESLSLEVSISCGRTIDVSRSRRKRLVRKDSEEISESLK